MKTQEYLVTSAAGKTGSFVVQQLIEKGYPVRAMVRKLDERSDCLEQAGAEVVVADFFGLTSLRTVLNGITRAYFCYPPEDRLLEATTNFIVAAKEANVESIVNMSQIIAREGHPSPLSRQHWLAERVLDGSGVGVTHVRPTLFAEMAQITNAHHIAQEGKLYLPHGDRKHAPVTARDIARVVVAILTDPQPHRGITYTVTGEDRLSQSEIAGIIGEALGQPVEYVDTPLELWQEGARQRGFPDFLINHLSRVAEDYRNGLFDKVTDVVTRITGQPPQSFRDYVEENIEAFGKRAKATV